MNLFSIGFVTYFSTFITSLYLFAISTSSQFAELNTVLIRIKLIFKFKLNLYKKNIFYYYHIQIV